MTNHLIRFISSFLFFLLVYTTVTETVVAQSNTATQQFYQIKVYHLDDRNQEQEVDHFLKEAYIPALSKTGIEPVGVFKPVGQDTSTSGLRTYVLTPFESLDQLLTLQTTPEKDEQYMNKGTSYIHASHNQPPYSFIESIILKAFSHAPRIQHSGLDSPKSQRVYELRSYGSATEALNQNKVEMFNEGGEVDIFDRLGFNAIFYGNVIAGSKMPNLMYMTTFKNMESRNAHWESFRTDPQWEKLSAMEEYQHNVSRSDIQLLYPTEYSDL